MEQAKVEHLGGQGSTGSHSFRSQVTVLSGPGKTRAFRMVQYWGLRLKESI